VLAPLGRPPPAVRHLRLAVDDGHAAARRVLTNSTGPASAWRSLAPLLFVLDRTIAARRATSQRARFTTGGSIILLPRLTTPSPCCLRFAERRDDRCAFSNSSGLGA
jgi:hypothetical protein